MTTIAKQLKIKEFPFEIKDSKGNLIYLETSYGAWTKREYDSKGNLIYWENSDGYWSKRTYDSDGNVIYYENSDGVITDNRPKTDVQKAIELLTKEGLLVDGKILKQ
jgi:lactam utilization protein B